MQKYLKYLPSKKFTILTSVIIVLAVIIFVIFFMSSSGESFSITGNKNNIPLKVENQTVTEMIQNDTDGDGIPDWEEALWGTDKNKKMTFNNTPDATYIENKKKELKIEQGISADVTKLTETEKFAREFFTSYSAMKSSGQVDADTINNFSSALGQKIVNPELIDRYTSTDIKINNTDDTATRKAYYLSMQKLFKTYQSAGIGEELNIISQGLATNSSTGTTSTPDQYSKLPTIANAYQNFAKKIMELNVPSSLTDYHLKIANSSNNTGISVLNMGKMINDPIIGLSGLSQYQKYSDELVKTVAELETELSKQ
ncbi:MAG: thrombospondin type 3 repeat-containing protein [Candidatus Paceibacterota bacterium]